MNIEIMREAIPGSGAVEAAAGAAHGAYRVSAAAKRARTCLPSPTDELGCAGWDDLIEQARTGIVEFAGGELRISLTPAMTLIDVDGYLPSRRACYARRRRSRESDPPPRHWRLDRHRPADLRGKAQRQAAAAAIDAALPQPFERTAVNGFGFVQIVRPRTARH